MLNKKPSILIGFLIISLYFLSGCVQKPLSTREPFIEPKSSEEAKTTQPIEEEKETIATTGADVKPTSSEKLKTTQPIEEEQEAIATIGLHYKEVNSKQINIFVDLDPVQENISALQFDLNFDSSILDFKNVEISETTKKADKKLYFNKIEPGTVRGVIFGMNQNILSKNSIAKFTFDLFDVSKSIQEANLLLNSVVASSPKAETVPLNVVGFNIKNSKSLTRHMTDKEKCENSGGTWSSICPDCVGCPCESSCDCNIERKWENDIRKLTVKFKIEKNNECFYCKNNQECGNNSCGGGPRGGCRETTFVCEDGICIKKEIYPSGWETQDKKTYSCLDTKCVEISNLIGVYNSVYGKNLQDIPSKNILKPENINFPLTDVNDAITLAELVDFGYNGELLEKTDEYWKFGCKLRDGAGICEIKVYKQLRPNRRSQISCALLDDICNDGTCVGNPKFWLCKKFCE